MSHTLRVWCCLLSMLLVGCAAVPSRDTPASMQAVPAPQTAALEAAAEVPLVPLPFPKAIENAAAQLLTGKLTALGDAPRIVVIDPLVDAVTGEQTRATEAVQTAIARVIEARFPHLTVRPFSAENLARNPLVLVGTFTGINDLGRSEGARTAFQICLAMADLDTRIIVAKGEALAHLEGVDITPLPYFRDSPAWALDRITQAYVSTCRDTQPGDAMDSFYLARIVSAASVQQAIEHYHAGRYQAALDSYAVAARAAAGDELRILNGLYLANLKLGRQEVANLVFGRIVDFGLERQRIAVKFLFRPGSTAFGDPQMSRQYPTWLAEMASRTAAREACLEIIGHASRGGPEAVNERLSLLRAETIKQGLERAEPELQRRMLAHGVGSRDTLIGNGRDDASDELDRRVVFRVIDCASST